MNADAVASAMLFAAMAASTAAPGPGAQGSAEWQKKLAASERRYTGYTYQELFGAAESVLRAIGPIRLLKPSSAKSLRSPTPQKLERCLLVAQPRHSLYRWAVDYWNVCLIDAGGTNIVMQASATEQGADGLLPQYLPPFKATIPILPDAGLTTAEAQLFFERVDLQLQHKAKPWMSCTQPTPSDKLKAIGRFICRGGVISGIE